MSPGGGGPPSQKPRGPMDPGGAVGPAPFKSEPAWHRGYFFSTISEKFFLNSHISLEKSQHLKIKIIFLIYVRIRKMRGHRGGYRGGCG